MLAYLSVAIQKLISTELTKNMEISVSYKNKPFSFAFKWYQVWAPDPWGVHPPPLISSTFSSMIFLIFFDYLPLSPIVHHEEVILLNRNYSFIHCNIYLTNTIQQYLRQVYTLLTFIKTSVKILQNIIYITFIKILQILQNTLTLR